MSDTLTDDRRAGSSPRPPRGDGDPDRPPTASAHRTARIVRAFSLLTVLSLVGLGVLGVQGYDAARKIKGGGTATIVTDPAAPGFVAAVDATPVHLVAVTDASDALSALVVFVPDPAGGAGTVVWSLGELVVDEDGTKASLADIYKNQGFDAARAAFEKVLGFGATDALIAAPRDLMAAAGPGSVEVRNPDPVTVEVKGKRVEKFKAGTIELAPDELADYLTIRGAGELPENRSTRSGALFTALIARLADSGSTPGSSSSTSGGSVSTTSAAPSAGNGGPDLATILTAMGATTPDFIVLPTERQSFKGSYLYSPDTAAITDQLAGVVQFPISSYPGQRPRVRVLNGTSDTSMANAAAPDLAKAGGEVLLIGNATALDVATTTVVYSNDAFKDVADRIADAVGVTAQRTEDLSDAADIDVVLGADYQR